MTGRVRERLFVTAWPDEATVDALSTIPRTAVDGVRWVPRENWHVTLRFVGDADTDTLHDLLRSGDFPAARAELGPTVERLGKQLVVPVTGVDDLAAAVAAATIGLGEPPTHPFRGHLTIARFGPDVSPPLLGHPIRAAFDVAEIALVRSRTLATGAVYATLTSYPTGGGLRSSGRRSR